MDVHISSPEQACFFGAPGVFDVSDDSTLILSVTMKAVSSSDTQPVDSETVISGRMAMFVNDEQLCFLDDDGILRKLMKKMEEKPGNPGVFQDAWREGGQRVQLNDYRTRHTGGYVSPELKAVYGKYLSMRKCNKTVFTTRNKKMLWSIYR